MRTIKLFVAILLSAFGNAYSEELCNMLSGASIYAQDSSNTYLGKISSHYDSDSIFNTYGNFGSKYSSNSLWDTYGNFGDNYSDFSAQNRTANKPPIIVKQGRVIGYLSGNKSIQPSVSPNLVKALCESEIR